MADERILHGRKDAALLLSLSVRSLDYYIARGDLPVRRVGRRVLISRGSLENFARRDHPAPTKDRNKP